MKREICAPEVPASQMVLTIITDEQLETFACRNGRNCFPWAENGDDDSSYVPISKR